MGNRGVRCVPGRQKKPPEKPSISECISSNLKKKSAELASEHSKGWFLYGTGSVGDKAQQLFDKTPIIEEAGFFINPRAVLRMGWFEGFKSRNKINEARERGAPPDVLQDLIDKGEFSDEEKATIREIAKQFGGKPIVVRSSAYGDSQGTGVYESIFCMNYRSEDENDAELEKAIKSVLKSENSENAIAFRKDLGLRDGMAVMIEPVFGKEFVKQYSSGERRWCSAEMSGCGHTSLPSGVGSVVIVAGLPTKAVKGQGIRIDLTEDNVEFELRWTDHLANPKAGEMIKEGDMLSYGSIVKQEGLEQLHFYNFGGSDDPESLNDIMGISLESLNSKLETLEQLAGKPQYVEFSMRIVDGKEEYVILQIAEVEEKDMVEIPENVTGIVVTSDDVVGEGKRECDGIVVCQEIHQLPNLYKFNDTHSNYLLMLDSHILSSLSGNSFGYSQFSNAAVVMVCHDGEFKHSYGISGHFKGLSGAADKLMLTAPLINSVMRVVEKASGKEFHAVDGLYVMPDIKMEVVTSEIQGKGIARIAQKI